MCSINFRMVVVQSLRMGIMCCLACVLFLGGVATSHVAAHAATPSQRHVHLPSQMTHIQQVQEISCVNSAAFVMNFNVNYLDPATGNVQTVGGTDNYPVGQERTIDLGSLGIPDGAFVQPNVHAILGSSATGSYIEYTRNSGVATYRVTGTTFNINVGLIG